VSVPAIWAAKVKLDEPTRLEMYRKLCEIRHFEQRAYDLFLQNLVKGTSHLSLGQEAVAVGFEQAMRHDDYTFCTYRGHAHTLVRGASMTAMMAELLGRETGILSGKGGSMHLTSVEHYAMGSYAVVGSHLPVAVGAGWSAQARKSGQVSVCFFGDGTTNIGAFHEALNLAAVWSLPVVFVCENNLYMEYTPISLVTSVDDPAADRASAYGLEPLIVDGNDVEEVYGIASVYIERARQGGGPALIEAKTYRKGGHSRADPAKYRPQKEVEEWLARDALDLYRARLTSSGIDEGVLEEIDAEAIARVDRATDEAKSAPPPPPSILETNVWADGGSAWRN
jgi:acetoin:2,6-dichlorophenolindophenol oxidoreductase subunit alpha